jgi:hypothetical protein
VAVEGAEAAAAVAPPGCDQDGGGEGGDTNVAASRCAYDRIIVTDATTTNLTGAWGVNDAFVDTAISDHWPVWAELWGDERE